MARTITSIISAQAASGSTAEKPEPVASKIPASTIIGAHIARCLRCRPKALPFGV